MRGKGNSRSALSAQVTDLQSALTPRPGHDISESDKTIIRTLQAAMAAGLIVKESHVPMARDLVAQHLAGELANPRQAFIDWLRGENNGS